MAEPKRIDNTAKILKNLEQLNKVQLRWGVQGEDNVNKMIWNEFGTKTTPERPAFRLTFGSSDTQKKVIQETAFAMEKIVKGLDFRKAADGIGEVGLQALKKTFTSDIAPENAESTIKKKGEGKNTLYDSGELFRSLGYEVATK